MGIEHQEEGAMIYYLDTNAVISVTKEKNMELAKKIHSFQRSKIKVPSMVRGELLTGAHKSNNAETMKITLDFIDMFETIAFDEHASEIYARVRASMEKKGNIIGSNDLIIAATVMSRGGVLVTNNTKEFERVEGLQIEDWSI
jgi:tRNA(fMet)-specific endonuclease VapC